MTKRKPSPRLTRARGTAFLAEVKPGIQVLGIMQNKTTVSFFNHFTTDPDADIDLSAPGEVLFTASVWKGFFAEGPVWRVDTGREDVLDSFTPPDQVIRIRAASEAGEKPGWDGSFPDFGGDLWRLRDPLFPDTASTGTLVKADLRCDSDRAAIEGCELSVVQTTWPLKERLEACRLSGRNVDPYKAKVFDGCDFLKTEAVLQTHYYVRGRMPLLGLHLDGGKWVAD